MAILVYGSGGGSGNDISDTTAIQSDVLPGKYFYLADGTKVEGSMATKAAATIIPSTSNQDINAGQYLSGKQTIQGSANLKAENIKKDVSIFGVTGTCGNLHSGTMTSGSGGDYRRMTLSNAGFIPRWVFVYLAPITAIDWFQNRIIALYAYNSNGLQNDGSFGGTIINSSGKFIYASSAATVYSISTSSLVIAASDSYSFHPYSDGGYTCIMIS